jgi:hypothetical protein
MREGRRGKTRIPGGFSGFTAAAGSEPRRISPRRRLLLREHGIASLAENKE